MYLPDVRFAAQTIECPGYGQLVRYPIDYDKNDAYPEVLVELAKLGLHRNVFLIDKDGQAKWRIGDYEQPLPDYVCGIRPCDRLGHATAVTFHSWILDIDLYDGNVAAVDRTK